MSTTALMLIDANLLIYATDENAPEHERASTWLADALNEHQRIGIPWQSVATFIRIISHPRISANPLTPAVAWQRVEDWLAAPAAWVPTPGRGYAGIVGRLIAESRPSGNLIPDLMLAALALEHGLALCSADTDFARFPGLTWTNPLMP